MNYDPPLSTTQTAERLRAAFGHSIDYWSERLRNERRPGREPRHPIPWVREGSRFAYPQRVLDTWIAGELARRLADGQTPVSRAGEALEAFGAFGNEAATGRRLECRLNAQFDEARREPFAQLTITYPLLVFRLSPAQVRDLATEFAELADYFEGKYKPAVPRSVVVAP